MPGNTTRARIIRWALQLCAVLAALDGCTSSQGLSHDSLQSVIRQGESRFVDAPAAAVAPPRLNGPTLGFYLKPTGFLRREFEWTGHDRDMVLAWSKQVPLGQGGKSAGFLTLTSLKDHTLTELRTTAARYGVDWVLIFDGAVAIDRYNNYKAPLLYWTLIGAYLVDGTHSDALCLLKATLWDVKTGARLFEEQAEAETKSVGPAALVVDKEQVERARTMAMNTLLQRLADRFATFAGPRQ